MTQTRITEESDLLNEKGDVLQPGWCEHNLYRYSRSQIKANATRIKEWDFYQISDKRYTVQMTFADISIGGAGCFTFFDRETGERLESMSLNLFTFGKLGLAENADKPGFLKIQQGSFSMSAQVTPEKRILMCDFKKKGNKYHIEISMDILPGLESLVMAVPFKQKKHFYLNQKTNSMPASGFVSENGEKIAEFDKKTAFCVLDWGRGVWPYSGSWYWGNGSTYLDDGHIFGFEIGWGFGDMSYATENMLFYDGKAHKIEEIYLSKDENDYMKPWVFTSNDDRFEMTMIPQFDNYTSSRVLGLVGNKCHQVFGLWSGKVVLDDGTVLNIKDMLAFCEFSDNRW